MANVNNETPVVYISGPLKAAADLNAARSFYELLAEVCRRNGLKAYLPHQRTDPIHHAEASAASVFKRDIDAMLQADLIVAYIGAPSSGVGAELAFAHQRAIPTIALYGPEGVASRFIEGMLEDMPGATLVAYADENDCCNCLGRELRRFVAAIEPATSAVAPLARATSRRRDERQRSRS
jgi:nucleoside 2-deoxyribosyltransferase